MFVFGTIRSKFHCVRKTWQLKTPHQKWQTIFNTGRVACDAVGVRMYSDNKIVWYTSFGAIIISTCVALILYTIPFYCLRNEFIRSIECSCPLGIIIPVSTLCVFVTDLAFFVWNSNQWRVFEGISSNASAVRMHKYIFCKFIYLICTRKDASSH